MQIWASHWVMMMFIDFWVKSQRDWTMKEQYGFWALKCYPFYSRFAIPLIWTTHEMKMISIDFGYKGQVYCTFIALIIKVSPFWQGCWQIFLCPSCLYSRESLKSNGKFIQEQKGPSCSKTSIHDGNSWQLIMMYTVYSKHAGKITKFNYM
jgi:hypothetical protein